MSTFQTAANVLVALKRETTTGVAATASGASRVRFNASPGLSLKRANVLSPEKRTDGLAAMPRLGGKSVDGTFTGDVTIGGANDILWEALMRTTWVTATTLAFASVTTVAIGTSTLTGGASTDFVGTNGFRVGDVFTLASTTVTADNNLNLPIIAVGSATISTLPAALATLSATATGTLTIMKRAITATTPTRYTHTIEQYDQDIDLSELFLGCRVVGGKLSVKPGAMATIEWTFMGLDRTILTTGTSPWFTSPTVTTGASVVSDACAVVYNGGVVATFTGFEVDFKITAKGEPVIGTLVSPDVFDNNLTVTGSISGVRSDFSNLTLFDAETEFGVNIMLQDTAGPPLGCLNIFLPRVKIGALSAPVGGQDGAKIEALTLDVGPKVAATGYDAGIAVISSNGS